MLADDYGERLALARRQLFGDMTDDLLRLWARVEQHLRAASALVVIDAPAQRLFDEFPDHNELGLAFQTLVAALATAPPRRRQKLTATSRGGVRDEPPRRPGLAAHQRPTGMIRR